MTNLSGYTIASSCEQHEIRPGTVFLSMSGVCYTVTSLDDGLGLVGVTPEGFTVEFLMDPREIRDNPLLTIVACGIG